MLAIQLNNTFLDLFPNTALTITMLNPLFDQDSFVRVFAYPFKIPSSALNLSLLSHINRLDNCSKRKYPVTMFIGGMPFEEGVLEVKGSTSREISVVFKNKALNLLQNLETLNIREVMETVKVPVVQESEYRMVIVDMQAGVEYELLINDQRFAYTHEVDTTDIEVLQYFVSQINVVYENAASFSGSFLIIKNPEDQQLDLIVIEGFELKSSVAPPVANQINLQALAADMIANPREDFAFPLLQFKNLYGEANPLFNGFVNYYLDGNQLKNEPTLTEEEGWQHTYIPQLRVRYILNRIAAAVGLSDYSGEWWTDADMQQLLLHSNYALDQVDSFFDNYPVFDDFGNLLSENKETQYLNGYKSQINLADHVPDIAANQFLAILTEGFNLQVDYRSNRLLLSRKISQLQHPPMDWTSLAEPDYEQNFVDEFGYTLDFLPVEGEQQVLTQLQPLQIEDGTQRIDLPFRPLHQSIGAPHSSDQLLEPSILRSSSTQVSGSSDELGVGVNTPAVRFFFDRGMQPDTKDRPYNLAIHGTENIKGEVVGEQSLDLKGDNGLYENYFKGYIQLQDNKTVTKRFRLGMAQLLELRKWENARIAVHQAEGSFEGIVKQVRFQVTTRRMLVAEVELVSTV